MEFPFRQPRKGPAVILKRIDEIEDGFHEQVFFTGGEEVEVTVDQAGRAFTYNMRFPGGRVSLLTGEFRFLSPLELLARCAP